MNPSALPSRLALAALRGVLQELEGDPTDAGEVLARVLGGGRVAPTPPPPTPVAASRRPSRPPAAPTPKARKAPATPPETEAQELLRQLVERHGSPAAVAERFGLSPVMVKRWRGGASASPTTLSRLRAAVASPPADERQDEAEEPAETAFRGDDAG